ncbi:MAG TPA: extracellular solute-binding protein [Chloroflexota bacterium]|nr:extracellular solute-binding protein [Chloroflexota bacterium]
MLVRVPVAARSFRFPMLMGAALVLTLTACGAPSANTPTSSGPSSSPTASGAAQTTADLSSLIAAAKQEGKVAVVTNPGEPFRRTFDAFQQKYGISVELLTGNGGGDLVPQLTAERKAGQYLWDVMPHSSQPILALKQMMAPLQPAMLLPEVLDDSKWLGGFGDGWEDHDKTLAFAYSREATWNSQVNRSVVPESQLSSIDQLWDPQWKGKIAMQDPRELSSGAGTMAAWLALRGEDRVRAFLRDQQPVVTRDRRQLGEWVVRGQYPIGLAVSMPVLLEFQAQGLDISSIKPLDTENPLAAYLSVGGGVLGMFDHTPHPNAAKLFVNWLLSAEGQTVFSRETGYNSRRSDVPVVDQKTAIGPNTKYTIDNGREDFLATVQKVVDVSRELIK